MKRVLLVDDSAFVRRAAERMLAPLEGVQVVGHAADGEEAVRKVRELRPDLVVMDIQMPGMDGLQALEQIMAENPTPVLLLSSLTREGAEVTLRALEAGAVDFLDKTHAGTTPMDLHTLAPVLQAKVRAILGSGRPLPSPSGPHPEGPGAVPSAAAPPGTYEVVAIGTSTGGPRALSRLIPALPEGFGAGVVVAQHMPAGFTETLAERLDRNAPLEVREAQDGDRVVRGRVLIVPGGRQLTLRRDDEGLRVRVWDDGEQLYRPSVDLLFESVAKVAGSRGVGVVLTGMGNDGARGLARIRSAGGRTLVESARTAVIDGMPEAARPYAEQTLPLEGIAPALTTLCGGG